MDDRHDQPYARAPEPDDLVRVCRALNTHGARYVLIGADAHTIMLDDVPVPVASPAALIRTKDTYRPEDAIDRDYLRRIQK